MSAKLEGMAEPTPKPGDTRPRWSMRPTGWQPSGPNECCVTLCWGTTRDSEDGWKVGYFAGHQSQWHYLPAETPQLPAAEWLPWDGPDAKPAEPVQEPVAGAVEWPRFASREEIGGALDVLRERKDDFAGSIERIASGGISDSDIVNLRAILNEAGPVCARIRELESFLAGTNCGVAGEGGEG